MSHSRRTVFAALLAISIGLAGLAALLVFSGVLPPFDEREVSDAHYGPASLAFEFVDFDDLPGWRADDQAEAIPVFLRSCERLRLIADDAPANPHEALGEAHPGLSLGGTAGDWRAACQAARALAPGAAGDGEGAAAARGFFERHFRPVKIFSRRAPLAARPIPRRPAVSDKGLYTGYFEPVYQASATPSAEYSAAVLARPDDLVMVDLGAFRAEFAGERIAGYVENGALHPYPDHQAINDGALGGRAVALAFLRPDDLFFMQIQGSGRLKFPDGREVRVGYDGQNGRRYLPIGKALVERGEMALDEVTMDSIRAWLDAAPPQAARALREMNPSYVFFRALDADLDADLGPLGAQGAPLTALRSLAVDRRFHTLGAPIWATIPAAAGAAPAMQRLFIAQDAGGAIRGPLRGDVFFGSGAAAGDRAGGFKAQGEMVVLAPAPVAARLAIARAKAAPGGRLGDPR